MGNYRLGNYPVISGTLTIPISGAWTADVRLASTSAPSGTTTLTIHDNSLVGTIIASAADYASPRCRIVAGRGRLDVTLPPKDYRDYRAADIALDAIREAGEVGGIWDTLDVICPHWLRPQASVRSVLQRLSRLDPLSSWTVSDSGTIDLVQHRFNLYVGSYSTFRSFGDEKVLVLHVDDIGIRPGMSIQAFGRSVRVNRTMYEWDERQLQCMVWYD